MIGPKLAHDDKAVATAPDTSSPFFQIGRVHLARITSQLVSAARIQLELQRQYSRNCMEYAQMGQNLDLNPAGDYLVV